MLRTIERDIMNTLEIVLSITLAIQSVIIAVLAIKNRDQSDYIDLLQSKLMNLLESDIKFLNKLNEDIRVELKE